MNQAPGDKFMLSTEIATKFKFKEVVKPRFPKLFKTRELIKRQTRKFEYIKQDTIPDKVVDAEEENVNKEV